MATKVKVLIARKIRKPGIDILKKICEVKVNELDPSLIKEEPIGEVEDINGLVP